MMIVRLISGVFACVFGAAIAMLVHQPMDGPEAFARSSPPESEKMSTPPGSGPTPDISMSDALALGPEPRDQNNKAARGTQLIAQGRWPILRTAWTVSDERGYADFVRAIGESHCRTVDSCLKSSANPYRFSDPPGARFYADCADLPYLLRAYYAAKNGLPFVYASAMIPARGHTRDIRYSFYGNRVYARVDVLTFSQPPLAQDIFGQMINYISSAMYRTDSASDDDIKSDHYPVALNAKTLAAGTVIYDPAGHLAVIYGVEADGRILFIDSHPDNSLTRGVYGKKFARTAPMRGGGFKKWRPVKLEGAERGADGIYRGGHIVSMSNADLKDFSLEQYYGTSGDEPARWPDGRFVIGNEEVDYYDYVRAAAAGGNLVYDPVRETVKMIESLCSDLHYRADAVNEAIAAGMHRRAQPARLPPNIYGTTGDWEIYSSPSRDARLKVSFRELYDAVAEFIRLADSGSPRLAYSGNNIRRDLLAAYDSAAGACRITYIRSDGRHQILGFNEIVDRLFRLDFDPYHCIERRWGANGGEELASCPDGSVKKAWYEAEQRLRNQLERTYDARMDADLDALRAHASGTGVDRAPEIDVRMLLQGGLAASSGLPGQTGIRGRQSN
jgi:hypothetical protein